MIFTNNKELADAIEALRYTSRSIASTKPEQDRAERQLEVLMRDNAKQIIKALDPRPVKGTP